MASCQGRFSATQNVLFLIVTICFANCQAASPPPAYLCSENGNYTNGSQAEKNMQAVFRDLVTGSSHAAAYTTSIVGQNSSDPIYGLLQCRGDTNSSQCNQCAQDAVSSMPAGCGTSLGGRAWFDYCYIRFENWDFRGQLDLQLQGLVYMDGETSNGSNAAVFLNTVLHLFRELNTRAVQSIGSLYYAYGVNDSGVDPVYGFVQCWSDISEDDCKNCLDFARNVIYDDFNGSQKGRVLLGNCFNRYQTFSFFNSSVSLPPLPAPASAPNSNWRVSVPPGSNKSGNKLPVILGVTGGGLLLGLLLLLCCLFLCCRRRIRRQRACRGQTTVQAGKDDDLGHEDKLMMFSMELLIAATNNFDESLKVGKGGFGTVYKGTLADGKEVAVKMLHSHSIHGKQEFLNEINALARVKHRNLIDLLGCCTEGSHRILVYELLPNGSLDKILFDRQRAKSLDWEKRYKIILGITKALLYLHEDSKMKIIHRDIKAENILLDNRLNPKVADFGEAKLFKNDESHIQTKVAGTFGYMAPEYAMEGQLSSKADVYSFGVLVLEIITGKKISEHDPEIDALSLVGWAWRLHQEGNISKLVDEAINLTYVMKQVSRCVHVALLCTQSDSSLRPSMSAVKLMLSSASVTLPNPTQPAYVNLTQDHRTSSIQGSTTSESSGTKDVSIPTISMTISEPR